MNEEVQAQDMAKLKAKPVSKTRFIAFVGLCIAIMAVSAWVVIPFGPIPFTLQIFAVAFAILVLPPKQCMAAVGGYLLLGAIGVPVFSGMRGGIGVLAGPTGGYLWGYLLGAAVALVFLHVMKSAMGDRLEKSHVRGMAVDIIAALLYVAVAYVCGWAQYMAVSGVSPEAAFVATVAPFVLVDVIKVVAAAFCARGVRLAVPQR
ncbi:biotin transporter BioY [Eggerthellaceae bacterium 3-80]